MSFEQSLGHEALLTLARKTEAAARDGDRQRLEANALRLLEALADHVDAERPAVLGLSAHEARVLLDGQQRVIGMLIDLAGMARNPGPCRCDDIAQQVLARLTLQSEDEHHSLTGPMRADHVEIVRRIDRLTGTAAGHTGERKAELYGVHAIHGLHLDKEDQRSRETALVLECAREFRRRPACDSTMGR